MDMDHMKRELQLYLWLLLLFPSLLVQGPPTSWSPWKRQQTTDSSGQEEDENQLDYSSDKETKDIACNKSDDILQQQKKLWNGEGM